MQSDSVSFRLSIGIGGGTAQSQYSCLSIHHQLDGSCSALFSVVVTDSCFRRLLHRDISVRFVAGDRIST